MTISEKRKLIQAHPDYRYSSSDGRNRRYIFTEQYAYSFKEAYNKAKEYFNG